MKIPRLILQFLVGGVLIYLGLQHVHDPRLLISDLRQAAAAANAATALTQVLLPWVQILAGALLIPGWLSLRCVFGAVFIYAGIMKAWRPMVFLEDIRSFNLLPDPYAAMLALFLPWVEILGGLAVVTGLGRKGGLLVLNTSLVIFLVAILVAWSRGTDIRCGCFGDSGAATSNYVELVVRDVALLLLGIFLTLRSGKNKA